MLTSLIDRLQYGQIDRTYRSPLNGSFRLPESAQTILAVLERKGLSSLVDPFFVEGKKEPDRDHRSIQYPHNRRPGHNESEEYFALAKIFQDIGDAYLSRNLYREGIFRVNLRTYLLPLDPLMINGLVGSVERWNEVSFQEISKYGNHRPHELRALPTPEDGKKKAQQYLRELIFWQLPWTDYQETFHILATERIKKTRGGRTQHTLLVDKKCTQSFNPGKPYPMWKVELAVPERVVISGYEA